MAKVVTTTGGPLIHSSPRPEPIIFTAPHFRIPKALLSAFVVLGAWASPRGARAHQQPRPSRPRRPLGLEPLAPLCAMSPCLATSPLLCLAPLHCSWRPLDTSLAQSRMPSALAHSALTTTPHICGSFL